MNPRGESAAWKRNKGKRMQYFFAKHDRNRDGVVSKREFIRTAKLRKRHQRGPRKAPRKNPRRRDYRRS